MGGRGGGSGLPQAYRPASSIEQAEKYLSKLTGEEAKFAGISLNVANAVNEALKEVYDRLGERLEIREVNKVKADWERYMLAGYQNGVLSIKGNPSTWEKSAKKNFKDGWLASGDKYGTLYHEFGHAMWNKLSSSQRSQIDSIYKRERRKAYESWMADGGSRSGKSQAEYFGRTLSRYAHTSTQEFFSEAFSQIMSRRMRPVSREVLSVIDRRRRR